MDTMNKTVYGLLILTLLLLAACGGAAVDVEEATATPEPAGALDTLAPPSPTAVPPTATATATATALPPTATPSPLPPTATATPDIAERAPTFEVAYVPAGDQLNVRTDPDPDAEIAGTLRLWQGDVEVTGEGEQVGEHLWLPIEAGDLSGWVNSLYLTEMVPPDDFCEDEATEELVEAFREAVAGEDEGALAELIDPDRGLRVRVSWWNPEVWLLGEEVENLLSSDTEHDFGFEDGSGNPIEGSFQDVILPMFERDLLPADERACNEILHGGTAGIVQLPEEVEGLNYYAFYRPPGPDQVEMDWGTWVVGVERWQGEYQIAFLVHFAWEI